MQQDKPQAFILTGAFWVVCRNPLYLTELADRGIKILVITAAIWREQALACMDEEGHPAASIDDIAFVDGELNIEGSFTAGTICAARRWLDDYTIVGVHSVGETLVEPTGLLADALGLPSPGLRATRACRSKYLQRWYMPDLSPWSVVVPAAERDAFDWSVVRYPCVVKPASRHSSSGVVTVNDAAELSEQVRTYPPHEIILVEQKIIGQEYSVESLVQNGKPVFASATRKETTDSYANTFVELAHAVPCEQPDATATLLAANQQMLDLLGFENGIAHSEWRIDESGRAYLMEVAARTPGDGLMALYQLATGSTVEPEIIRVALGEPASYPEPRRYTRQVYPEHTPGLLTDVTVDWPGAEISWVGEKGLWPDLEAGAADAPPTLRAVLVLKDRDTRLGELGSSDDRAVAFFIDARTPDELDALEKQVRAAITIHTTPTAE
jgi:hypothetical protein